MDSAVHYRRIIDCLDAMQIDPSGLEYELLPGGISGAATYRIHLAHEDVVLKIVEENGARDLRERAHRELSFYREFGDRVPLRIPVVRGSWSDGSWCGLCLRAYRPPPPIEDWSERQYVSVATELGQLHGMFWDNAQRLVGPTWLRARDWSCDSTTLRQAVTTWRQLLCAPGVSPTIDVGELRWIERMLSRIDLLQTIGVALPPTLCHGDFHHGNLLVDVDAGWVWADWQEVGIGLGPEDLSFMFQRARAAGGTVPEDAAIVAYHQSLETASEHSVDLATVRRVMNTSELRTLLLFWPPFLAHLPAHHLVGVVQRLHELAGSLKWIE